MYICGPKRCHHCAWCPSTRRAGWYITQWEVSTKYLWVLVIPNHLFDQLTSFKMTDEISRNLATCRVLIVASCLLVCLGVCPWVTAVSCVTWERPSRNPCWVGPKISFFSPDKNDLLIETQIYWIQNGELSEKSSLFSCIMQIRLVLFTKRICGRFSPSLSQTFFLCIYIYTCMI